MESSGSIALFRVPDKAWFKNQAHPVTSREHTILPVAVTTANRRNRTTSKIVPEPRLIRGNVVTHTTSNLAKRDGNGLQRNAASRRAQTKLLCTSKVKIFFEQIGSYRATHFPFAFLRMVVLLFHDREGRQIAFVVEVDVEGVFIVRFSKPF